MKIKEGFLLKEIIDLNGNTASVVVAVGKASKLLSGYLKLNDTASFFWKELSKNLSTEQILLNATKEYKIDKQTLEKDLNSFINTLKKIGAIDE